MEGFSLGLHNRDGTNMDYDDIKPLMDMVMEMTGTLSVFPPLGPLPESNLLPQSLLYSPQHSFPIRS